MTNPMPQTATARSTAGSTSSKAGKDGTKLSERLLDSEEHAVNDAIPPVAVDAAEALVEAEGCLRLAATLLREALNLHIYNAEHDEKPAADCAYTAGLTRLQRAILMMGQATTCDECQAPIPDEHTSAINDFHAETCSAYPEGASRQGVNLDLFTVLLLYPDYLSDNFGEETYLAHVTAEDAGTAALVAQAMAQTGNGAASDPADFAVLFVLQGHHHDLKGV